MVAFNPKPVYAAFDAKDPCLIDLIHNAIVQCGSKNVTGQLRYGLQARNYTPEHLRAVIPEPSVDYFRGIGLVWAKLIIAYRDHFDLLDVARAVRQCTAHKFSTETSAAWAYLLQKNIVVSPPAQVCLDTLQLTGDQTRKLLEQIYNPTGELLNDYRPTLEDERLVSKLVPYMQIGRAHV